MMLMRPDLFFERGPAFDVFEDDKAITVEAELPRMTDKDVTVTIHDGVLTISGEKKIESEKTVHRLERWYGAFERSFTLPETVDVAAVDARVADGVLTVTLPKKEAAVPKRIEVKVK